MFLKIWILNISLTRYKGTLKICRAQAENKTSRCKSWLRLIFRLPLRLCS